LNVTAHFLSSVDAGQTSWERRHPCLLASVSRSLPEPPQARMGGAPRMRSQEARPTFAPRFSLFQDDVVNLDHLSGAYFYRLKAQLQRLARQVIVIEDKNLIDRAQIAGSGGDLAQFRLSLRIAFHVASRNYAFDLFQSRPFRQERRRSENAAAVNPVICDARIGRPPDRIAFELDGDAERRAGLI